MHVIETERTSIRQVTATDLESLYSVCGSPELMRFVGDGKALTKEQTAEWIRVSVENYKTKGFGMWAVVAKASQTFMGYCGLVYSSEVHDYELIYALQKDFHGLGIATEIAKATVKFGFERLNLKTVYASIDPENIASERILLKTGFSKMETKKDEFGLETLYFSLLPVQENNLHSIR